MDNDPVVIVGAARTPMAGLQGDFASLAASDLGAVAIKGAIERAGITRDDVDKVIMGCVRPARQGQAPARQAALKAGRPMLVHCTTATSLSRAFDVNNDDTLAWEIAPVTVGDVARTHNS